MGDVYFFSFWEQEGRKDLPESGKTLPISSNVNKKTVLSMFRNPILGDEQIYLPYRLNWKDKLSNVCSHPHFLI